MSLKQGQILYLPERYKGVGHNLGLNLAFNGAVINHGGRQVIRYGVPGNLVSDVRQLLSEEKVPYEMRMK